MNSLFLCNCYDLDFNYNHTPLFKNVQSQINFFNSRIVYTYEDMNYQRKNRNIKINKSIEELKYCNYCMVVNNNESRRYYYFIVDKIYIGENTTEIVLRMDLLQSYLFEIYPYFTDNCFIEREHIQRYDEYGYPNLLHNQEENLNTGELKIIKRHEIYNYKNKGGYIITSSDRLGVSDEKRGGSTGGDGGSGGDEETRQKIVNSARKLIGLPYVWGGNYPPLGNDKGTDCSGLCQWAYNDNGEKITRTTYTQINEGFEVSETDLLMGDLVFSNFNSENLPEHVFLYSGKINGKHQCIEAPYEGVNIREREFTWVSTMRARRILKNIEGGSSGNSFENGYMSKNGLLFVKAYESFSPVPYALGDGTLTTGYGVTEVHQPDSYNQLIPRCTEKQASEVLGILLKNNFSSKVLKAMYDNGLTKNDIKQCEFDAFCSYAYNSGIYGMTSSTMFEMYCQKQDKNKIAEIWLTYNIMEGSEFEEGLRNRRLEESNMFKNIYNIKPIINKETGVVISENNGIGFIPSEYK